MTRVLRQGHRGEDVRFLQAGFNQLAALPGRASRLPPLAVDGSFGPKTRARVLEFQAGNPLVLDGIVGPMTFGRLVELLTSANLMPRGVAGGVGPGPGKYPGKLPGKPSGKGMDDEPGKY